MTKDELITHLKEYIRDAHISQEDILPLFETIEPTPEEERLATLLHTFKCSRSHIEEGACTFYSEKYWATGEKRYWYDELCRYVEEYGEIEILSRGFHTIYNIVSCLNIDIKVQLFALDILIPYLTYYKNLKEEGEKKRKEERVPLEEKPETEILSSRLDAPISFMEPTVQEKDLEK